MFKGAELSEGCVEIPVSLQLVSLIEQYDALQDGCAPNDAISLENRSALLLRGGGLISSLKKGGKKTQLFVRFFFFVR